MSANPLYWDSSYEIVQHLIDTRPDTDLDQVSLDQLEQWILSLPNFADDPALANEGILIAILREWYEEIGT